MIEAIIFYLNGIFLKGRYLSDLMQEKYGTSGQEFLPALERIMDKVRRPGAPKIYSLWSPYFQKWGLNLSEGEFFDFWFKSEKLDRLVLDYVNILKDRGLKIFILSNNFRERTSYYRQNCPEIFKNIDKAYFSWETGFIKPNELAFRNILEENGLDPEECIYFDDSQKNVDVANSVGIHAIKYENLEKTKRIIENMLN